MTDKKESDKIPMLDTSTTREFEGRPKGSITFSKIDSSMINLTIKERKLAQQKKLEKLLYGDNYDISDRNIKYHNKLKNKLKNHLNY